MKLAYANADGTIAIIYGAPKSHLERAIGPLSQDAYEKYIIERSIPDGVTEFIRLPDDWTPPDRSKRDLWRIRNGQIVIEEPAV